MMDYRQWLRLGALALLVSAFAVIGIGLAWSLWGQHVWGSGITGQNGIGTRFTFANSGRTHMEADLPGTVASEELDILEVPDAVEKYLASTNLDDLVISEVIEFERGFYVLVKENATGVGAMELIVDKNTSAVRPEQGPNMMWNARYGMQGFGLESAFTDPNALSAINAREFAQRWLDEYRPGVIADDHADELYGYYTVHTYRDGKMEGMLSVRGNTGQVWYHTWHGACVQRLDLEGRE